MKILFILLIYSFSFFSNSILAQNNAKTLDNFQNIAINDKNIQNNSFYALYKQEIYKRFSNDIWEQNLTQLSEHALIQEYIIMLGISNHLKYMNMQTKQRVDALLASYTALKAKNQR